MSKDERLVKLSRCVERYIQAIRYTGNFSAEFLYANGRFYFLEINLRNDGTSWLSTSSGYNLPDMVVRGFYEADVDARGYTFRQRNYMNIMLELMQYKDRVIGLGELLRGFNAKTCYSVYNKNDKATWKAYFNKPLKTIAMIIFRRYFPRKK